MKALEYMAHGLPFIAFDLRETRSIADGAAVFVRPEDVDAFARTIDELLHHPRRRAALGRTGKERVRDELSWERQARTYLDVVLGPALRRRSSRRRVRPKIVNGDRG